MRRVAVYAGTRNVYHSMVVAAKSLLRTTRMDKVVFLTEDKEFPEELPPVIQNISMRGQKWFPCDGSNYTNAWTYMTLVRLALPEILPDEMRCVWLDVDTIALSDLGGLFDMDLKGRCIAAVEEPKRSLYPFVYHNAGVQVMDLARLRLTGLYKVMIDVANTRYYKAPDQDVLNLCCQPEILTIDPKWNSSSWTKEVLNAKIMHYAGIRDYERMPHFMEVEKQGWKICR